MAADTPNSMDYSQGDNISVSLSDNISVSLSDSISVSLSDNISVSLSDNISVSLSDNISVSLSGEDKAEITGYREKLSDGATVTAPLEKAPWGDTFGMCKGQVRRQLARQHRGAAGLSLTENLSGSAGRLALRRSVADLDQRLLALISAT